MTFQTLISKILPNNSTLKAYVNSNYHPTMKVGGFFSLMRYYSDWKKLQQRDKSPLSEQLPWMNFEGIDYLKTILKHDMKVFEYGMGGSTVFFAKKTSDVVGVEHDGIWADKVVEYAKSGKFMNIHCNFIPPVELATPVNDPDYSDPNGYLSSDEKYLSKYSFYNYATAIDRYKDGYFDIISVDGRARPSCLKHAFPKVKVGGYLIVDNSDRHYYVEKLSAELQSFTKVFDAYGPGPFNKGFWGTTVYRKNKQFITKDTSL